MDYKMIFGLAAVSIGTRIRNKEVLRRWKDRPEKVLDLGCGVGIFCRDLINEGVFPIGMEYDHIKPLVGQKVLNTPFFSGDITSLPLKSGSIPVALVRDVLEHLPDDVLALHELRRCLRPGGTLLITVPNQNWGPFYKLGKIKSEDHGHLRLYEKTSLKKLLEDLDFRIESAEHIQNPLATLFEFMLIWVELKMLGEENVQSSQMTQMVSEKSALGGLYKLVSYFVWPFMVLAEYIFPENMGSEILIVARKK